MFCHFFATLTQLTKCNIFPLWWSFTVQHKYNLYTNCSCSWIFIKPCKRVRLYFWSCPVWDILHSQYRADLRSTAPRNWIASSLLPLFSDFISAKNSKLFFQWIESLWDFLATVGKEMEDRSLGVTGGSVDGSWLLEQDHINMLLGPALFKWMLPCSD